MRALALSVALAFLVVSGVSSEQLLGTYTPSKWFCNYSFESPALGPDYPEIETVATSQPDWVAHLTSRLSYRVTTDFRSSTLSDACATLAGLLGANIILSPEAISSRELVDLKTSSIQGVHALNWICRLAGADWVITDEAIYVFMNSERKSEDVEEPTLEEILDMIDEIAYEPPHFEAPEGGFGTEADKW
ncbi:MAG: hypothetical protein Kow00107_09910 [Planctomycetota bacterium]